MPWHQIRPRIALILTAIAYHTAKPGKFKNALAKSLDIYWAEIKKLYPSSLVGR